MVGESEFEVGEGGKISSRTEGIEGGTGSMVEIEVD